MKITILTTSFPRFEGDSAGTFVYKYARELARSGCGVRVIAPHDSRADPANSWCEPEVTRFRYFFPARMQSLAYGAGMISRIRKNALRLLQLPFFLTSFFLAALRAQRDTGIFQTFWSVSALIALGVKALKGVPVAVRLSGADILLLKIPVLSSILRRCLGHADAIICQSSQFKEHLTELGVTGNHVHVISNGIELDRFSPLEKSKAREKLSQPQNKTLVLCACRLSASKGHEHLIRAIPPVIKKHPDVRFIFVGDGETRDSLSAMAHSQGLDGCLVFAGMQDETTMPLWLNAADLFVLPSLLDGSPNILLEAMACGLPIIATTVGGIPEMITHGREGLLVPPKSPAALEESLLTLLGDPGLRERLGQNALNTVRSDYGTWEKQTAHLKKIYEDLLSPHSKKGR
ncbi:MAG: glycosyltransferase [Nitrospinaceae bacterium]